MQKKTKYREVLLFHAFQKTMHVYILNLAEKVVLLFMKDYFIKTFTVSII